MQKVGHVQAESKIIIFISRKYKLTFNFYKLKLLQVKSRISNKCLIGKKIEYLWAECQIYVSKRQGNHKQT